MANFNYEIAENFVRGVPVKDSMLSRVSKHDMGYTKFGTHIGTVRLGARGNELLSYEHWVVMLRMSDGGFILNADEASSKVTKEHQAAARSACKRLGVKFAFLPFSALRSARVEHTDITIVATTADRVTPVVRKRPDGSEYFTEDHFLGEVLFACKDRYYVSGLDRNDDPKYRKYYLARLPVGLKPATVDEALDMLRPANLPADTLRQGEWFLLPCVTFPKPTQATIMKSHCPSRYSTETKSGVPILADSSDGQVHEMLGSFVNRTNRHRASRMHLGGGAVFVQGMLRDEEHGSMKLGDGKTWYRVVRNTADGSWGSTGDVD